MLYEIVKHFSIRAHFRLGRHTVFGRLRRGRPGLEAWSASYVTSAAGRDPPLPLDQPSLRQRLQGLEEA